MLIFPILSVFIMYLDICVYMEDSENGKKAKRLLASLYSISIHTLILLAANEFLSLFHEIHLMSLSLLWIIMFLVSAFLFIIITKRKDITLSEMKSLLFFPKTIFTPIIIFLLIICCTALFLSMKTTPYNWDSMTYHLTRLTHWTQNGSIAHYVCHDIRQISSPPLAEFIDLHIYILSGYNDYFVNLLQTFSYIISVLLVYKISRLAGGLRLFSSLAALVFATTPIAFGEALTTQVDMLACLWLLIFVYSALLFANTYQRINRNIETFFHLLLIGFSAGFSYLSKPSTLIAISIFATWLLLIYIRRQETFSAVIKSIITVIITGVIIILPELMRNFKTFHSISSAETSTRHLVPSWNIRYLMENLIQNVGFNLPTKYVDIDHLLDKIIFKAASILYIGKQIPNTQLNFRLIGPSMSHDIAINPTITWLMVFAVLVSFIMVIFRTITKSKFLKQNISYGFILSGIISFLIFCAVVQWNIFITRFEIGYLALLASSVMLLFQYIFVQNERLIYTFVGIVTFICSITFFDLIQYHKGYAISTKTEEIRIMQYFAVRDLYWSYKEVSDTIIQKDYKDVGFICGIDSYEYPFWRMLENSINRFEHVCVANETEIYDDIDFLPDCIISVNVEINNVIEYHNTRYDLVLETEGVKLFERNRVGI